MEKHSYSNINKYQLTRVYTDTEGETHFEEFSVPLEDNGSIGWLSRFLPLEGMYFRKTDGSYHYDWHNTPRKQYVVMLGKAEMQVSDGEKRCFDIGDVVLLEDVEGKGHKTTAVHGERRKSLFLVIE